MPNPEGKAFITEDELALVRELVPKHTREDGTVNCSALGREAGLHRQAVALRLKRLGLEAETDPIPQKRPDVKPRVRVRAWSPNNEGQKRRVCAIGDLHNSPGKSVSHLKWISRWIADREPDNVVQIGDLMTLDSVSMHAAPGSAKYYERPVFADDLECGEEAMEALHSDFGPGDFDCTITLGNHEYRAVRAEEAAPNLKDTIYLPIKQLFAQWRWDVKEYGEWLFLDGVGFTHVPFNQMGKDYRGKVPENQIGNDATFSIVFGHTHKRRVAHFPKIGPNNRVTVLNLGTAMPYGTMEHYATLSTTGWTYGVFELTLHGGQIVGENFVSMLDLEERYA